MVKLEVSKEVRNARKECIAYEKLGLYDKSLSLYAEVLIESKTNHDLITIQAWMKKTIQAKRDAEASE
jgi:hypothetical protein